MVDQDKHYVGHRQRLKKRFMDGGLSALHDYEALELLFFLCVPRADVKPLAKDLLKKYQSLSKIMQLDEKEILSNKGVGESFLFLLKLLRETNGLLLKQDLQQSAVLDSFEKVIGYCKINMSHLPNEQLRILFLDQTNKLIADDVLQQGTVNQTPIYPREILKKALHYNAVAIIMVHNHPSGDVTPSEADVKVTLEVKRLGMMMNVTLHDHIIIGKNDFYSFARKNLL